MPKFETGGDAACDGELAAMLAAVVGTAQSHEPVRVVLAVFGAEVELMKVEIARVGAGGHHAATLIVSEHSAAVAGGIVWVARVPRG